MGSRLATPVRRRAASAAVAAIALLCLMLVAGHATAATSTTTTPPPPAQDPFYASPSNIATLANGAIIRSRAVAAKVLFLGADVPTTSWQVAYKSLDAQNNPVTDVTTIVVPTARYTGSSRTRPVISYQAAEDSTGSQCAPSYSLLTGSNILTGQEQSIIAYGLLSGYAMDIPDYEGLNSEYLDGMQAAHATLDGLRATLQFSTAGITPTTQIGMWGYSGGGHATAWAAELAPTYAPDLKITAVALGGAPPNLVDSFNMLNNSPYSGAIWGGVVGLSNANPQWDIQDQLNTQGKADIAMATNQCIINFGLDLALKNFNNDTTVPNAIEEPANAAIINANNLGQHVPVGPIYDYFSTNDEAIPTSDSQALVKKYCAEGVKVIEKQVILSEHATLALTQTPDVLSFFNQRFAGQPLFGSCLGV